METCDGCGNPITMDDTSVYVRDPFGKSDFGKTYHSRCLKDPRDERIAELKAEVKDLARQLQEARDEIAKLRWDNSKPLG